MDAELRRTIETAIDKHDYDFLFSYIKNISPSFYREICDFMILYLKNTHRIANNFWELAQRCIEYNFSLSKELLLRRDLKGIEHSGKQSKNIFHVIFSKYCQKDNNINDILHLMKFYGQMFDISFLNDISKVSNKFYTPSQYLLTISITGASQQDAIGFLMYNQNLCSLFTLAYVILDPNYNKKKKWIPFQREK